MALQKEKTTIAALKKRVEPSDIGGALSIADSQVLHAVAIKRDLCTLAQNPKTPQINIKYIIERL